MKRTFKAFLEKFDLFFYFSHGCVIKPHYKTEHKNSYFAVSSHKAQSGVVLIISLIMLMLLTMLGVGAIRSTELEEKMVGNMRNSTLAFQAAESALKAGEVFIGVKTPAELGALVFDCTGNGPNDGLFLQFGTAGCASAFGTVNNPNYSTVNWNANAVLFVGDLANIQTNPRYIIETLPCKDANGDGDCLDSGDVRVYRITARATGATPDAVVMVQSIYEMPS